MKIIGLFIFFILFPFSHCLSQHKSESSKRGILDLSKWDFEQKGNHSLDADWHFYYNAFLSASQMDTVDTPQYFPVPTASWTDYTWNGDAIPGTGYATYRLKVILAKKYRLLSISTLDQSTAYRIFVNNELVGESGKIGKYRESMLPDPSTHIFLFSPSSDTLDIVIHISNFNHRKGGLWNSLVIGTVEDIQSSRNQTVYMDLFLCGSLLLMSFYHFLLYFTRKKRDTVILHFSILCLVVPIRLISTGENFIMDILPQLPWAWKYRIEYISLFLMLVFITTILQKLFPAEVSKYYKNFIVLLSIATSLFVFISDPLYFTYSIYVLHLCGVLCIIFYPYWLVLAILHKREGAGIFTFGIVFLAVTIINDILYSSGVINTFYLMPVGFLGFFIAQSALIAIRSSKAYTMVEELSEKLISSNQNLEHKIEERTSQLQETNQVLYDVNQNLKGKNDDVTASINYARRIQFALLPLENKIKEFIPDSFIFYQPKDIVSGDFYWFSITRNEDIFFVVGDCTGHGVPGAFMTLIANSLLNQIVNEKLISEPAEILTLLDKSLLATLHQHTADDIVNDGMDISLLRINRQKSEIVFAGAKRSLIYFSNGILNEVKGSIFSIGGLQFKTKQFSQTTIEASNNDTFYLFTDGYTDQFGGNENKKFMISRFKELLNEIHNQPVGTQKSLLEENFKDWKGRESQVDDVLVSGFKL